MTHTEPLKIPLLSGATFPDWSVVISNEARASLNDTLGRLRMTTRWEGMSEQEETVRLAILRVFAKTGEAPTVESLTDATGLSLSDLPTLLAGLDDRDLIVLSGSGNTIDAAYPFTSRDTEHRVTVDGTTLKAMCAVDALGIGAMLNRDTSIRSKCRHCGCDIEIETNDNGHALASVSPETAIVWSGVQDIDGCAADTQCSVMAYFCSDDHLELWRSESGDKKDGHWLSIEQGLEAGSAIFIPFLASG